MGSNGSINAGNATGAVTVNAAALATNPFAYTGSSGIDTFTDGAVGGNQINTGAGNDVLTLTDKGNDNTSAATSVTMGAGQDDVTVNMTGNQSADEAIFVFAAGDSVSDSSTTGISATLTDTLPPEAYRSTTLRERSIPTFKQQLSVLVRLRCRSVQRQLQTVVTSLSTSRQQQLSISIKILMATPELRLVNSLFSLQVLQVIRWLQATSSSQVVTSTS